LINYIIRVPTVTINVVKQISTDRWQITTNSTTLSLENYPQEESPKRRNDTTKTITQGVAGLKIKEDRL
jgi:hypothetical protein